MKKVLFTATVDSHILHFHTPYLKLFKEKGYEVHVATNGTEEIPFCDVKHTVTFERSPFKINNFKAVNQLKKIIEQEKFDIIHTHTPMGSVVTRLAAKRQRKKGTRVIYTAHGFHFFKGASKINWLLFYPIEKTLAKITDDLITINKEDYELAKNKFKTNVHYVPGVGVDPKKFNFKMSKKEINEYKNKLGLKKDDYIILQVGELNDNKNQTLSILAMEQLIKNQKNIKLLLAGTGDKEDYYKSLVKEKQLEDNIIFLGYTKEVPKLLKITNILLSTSKREGLPVNVLEAIITATPVIATNCRGNRDLVNKKYIVDINDYQKVVSLIKKQIKNNNYKQKYKGEEFYQDKIIDKISKEIYQ